MITVPYLRVALKLDMSTTNLHTVPPHELAMLSEMYGTAVTVNGPSGQTREVDPAEEYQRLGRKYGMDKETKRPWVEVVFGRFSEGRLETTMEKGAKHYKPESPQKKAAKTRAANKLVKDQDAQDTVAAQDAA